MAGIRVVSWNIKNFAKNVLAGHQKAILRRLYDNGARRCDVFVIIEPLIKKAKPPVGSVIQKGAGCEGLMDLFYLLYAKDPLWKVVPPRASCCGNKSDFVAMLYHSGVCEFTGPQNMNPIPSPAGAAAIDPWGKPGGGPVPQVVFKPGTKEVPFNGRRPALAAFNGAKYRETRTYTLTVLPMAPVVGPAGALQIKTAQLPVGAPNEPYDFRLEHVGVVGTASWAIVAGGPLPAGLNFDMPTGRLHGTTAFTGTQAITVLLTDTTGFAVVTTMANLTLDFDAALRLRSGPALPDAVATVPYDITLDACGGATPRTWVKAFKAAEQLPPGLTLDNTGRLHGTPTTAGAYTFSVDTSDKPMHAFQIMGLHAPPDGGKNYPAKANATAIKNLDKVTEITGAAKSAVCGDFNCCKAACCNSGTTKYMATALTQFGKALTHHDFNHKTSLKTPGSATYLDYLSHYFDHIFTKNFASVPTHDVLDLITLDKNWATAQANAVLGNSNDFDVVFAKYAWPAGVSDHLPVGFELEL